MWRKERENLRIVALVSPCLSRFVSCLMCFNVCGTVKRRGHTIGRGVGCFIRKRKEKQL